jgi:aryl-alcohol dehydrogenase-like predicted oxidoreductase
MARAEDIAVTAWAILRGGVLTGKYREANAVKRYGEAGEESMQQGDAVVALANEIDRTPAQVAINWVRQRPWGGAPIIPILGARSEAQLNDNLGALDFQLDAEHIARLDKVSDIRLGFPHDFLRSDNVKNLIFGDTFELTHNHRAIN